MFLTIQKNTLRKKRGKSHSGDELSHEPDQKLEDVDGNLFLYP